MLNDRKHGEQNQSNGSRGRGGEKNNQLIRYYQLAKKTPNSDVSSAACASGPQQDHLAQKQAQLPENATDEHLVAREDDERMEEEFISFPLPGCSPDDLAQEQIIQDALTKLHDELSRQKDYREELLRIAKDFEKLQDEWAAFGETEKQATSVMTQTGFLQERDEEQKEKIQDNVSGDQEATEKRKRREKGKEKETETNKEGTKDKEKGEEKEKEKEMEIQKHDRTTGEERSTTSWHSVRPEPFGQIALVPPATARRIITILQRGHPVLLVCGPNESGKSVLCNTLLSGENVFIADKGYCTGRIFSAKYGNGNEITFSQAAADLLCRG